MNLDESDVKYILVEKNPSATLVAELVEDDKISIDIIKYNHYMLKGDIYKKKKILTQCYKELEKIIPALKQNGYNSIADDAKFLFNALGIRHDKTDNKITNEKVKNMGDTELEEWCDKTYEMFLCAELAANHVNSKAAIKALKTKEAD